VLIFAPILKDLTELTRCLAASSQALSPASEPTFDHAAKGISRTPGSRPESGQISRGGMAIFKEHFGPLRVLFVPTVQAANLDAFPLLRGYPKRAPVCKFVLKWRIGVFRLEAF
jgi:hypothetical protein